MTDNQKLTEQEWDAAMAFILASKDDEETPEAEPEEDAKLLPEAFLKNIKKKKAVAKPVAKPTVKDGVNMGPAEVWSTKVGKPQFTKNTVTNEIPTDGPSGGSSSDDPDAQGPDKWSVKIGKPESNGKPKVSMASGSPTGSEGDVWNVKTGTPVGTASKWSSGTPGTPDPNESPDGPTKLDKLNRAPTPTSADEDLDTDNNLSLPDGSFFIANVMDLKSAIGKVQNADQMNPLPNKPRYLEVKQHLAQRASDLNVPNLVPADWQMMMGKHDSKAVSK